MASSKLREICESEGIRQAEISRASGVAYGTVNKVYNARRDIAAVTRAKLAKAVSKLSGREYSVDDLFPTEGQTSGA